MAIIFSDTFTGTDGAAWGSGWTTSGTTGSTETIVSNRGRMHTGAVGGFADLSKAILTQAGCSLLNFEVQVSVTFVTAISPTYGYVIFGRASGDWANGDNPGQFVSAELDTNGSALIQYRQLAGSRTTLLSAAGGTFPITAGQAWWVKFRCTGTSIAAKFWKNDGGVTPEPAVWSLSGTQSFVNTAGVIQTRNLGGNAASSLDLDIDNFSLDNTVGTTGVGWYARGGVRSHRATRNFAHVRSSF